MNKRGTACTLFTIGGHTNSNINQRMVVSSVQENTCVSNQHNLWPLGALGLIRPTCQHACITSIDTAAMAHHCARALPDLPTIHNYFSAFETSLGVSLDDLYLGEACEESITATTQSDQSPRCAAHIWYTITRTGYNCGYLSHLRMYIHCCISFSCFALRRDVGVELGL